MKYVYQKPMVTVEMISQEEILTDIISVSTGDGISLAWDDLIDPNL